MNFQHTEDRRMLADSLNRYLSENNSIERRHKSAGSTLGYLDISTVYSGSYLMEFSTKAERVTRKVQVVN